MSICVRHYVSEGESNQSLMREAESARSRNPYCRTTVRSMLSARCWRRSLAASCFHVPLTVRAAVGRSLTPGRTMLPAGNKTESLCYKSLLKCEASETRDPSIKKLNMLIFRRVWIVDRLENLNQRAGAWQTLQGKTG